MIVRELLTGIITCAGLSILVFFLWRIFPERWKTLAAETTPVNLTILKITATIAFLYNTYLLFTRIAPGSRLVDRGDFFWAFYLCTSVIPLLLWWKKIQAMTISLLVIGVCASITFWIPLYISIFGYSTDLAEFRIFSELYFTTIPWAMLLYMLLYWAVLFMI